MTGVFGRASVSSAAGPAGGSTDLGHGVSGAGQAGSEPDEGGPRVGVRVRVPATSANLGPGFDAYGLALGYYDDVEVTLRRRGLSVSVTGAEQVSDGEDNLVVRAIRAAFDELGRPQPGLDVRCVNRIPHGRGLGSSAAAIVAGVAAAWALDPDAYLAAEAGGSGAPAGLSSGADAFDRSGALRVATAIEGHPDNVAAALFGGFTAAWTGPDGVAVHRAEPIAELRPVAFVPSARTSTSASRGRLPELLAHGDAAFSAGRAGLLALALTLPVSAPGGQNAPGGRSAPGGHAVSGGHGVPGDATVAVAARARLLMAATEDRLHQPYRLPAVPESAALVERLRVAGVASVLSGSGPTVLALAVGGAQAATAVGVPAPGFAVLPLAVDRDGLRVTSAGSR